MSSPERARDLAARLAAEVGVKTIIAAAKFFDLVLGGSPKLRPPAFDEAEAQRFLSDGAEQLAVAEEREEVLELGDIPNDGKTAFDPRWQAFGPGKYTIGSVAELAIVTCPSCEFQFEPDDVGRSFNCPECSAHMIAVRDYTPSNPAGAARPPKPSTGGVTISAPGSRSEAPVAADAPGPSSPVRAVDPGQPTIVTAGNTPTEPQSVAEVCRAIDRLECNRCGARVAKESDWYRIRFDKGSGVINEGAPQIVALSGAEYERYLDGALNERRFIPPATSADQTTSALMAALINQVRILRAVIVGDESRRRYIAELIADSEARAAQHEQVGD